MDTVIDNVIVVDAILLPGVDSSQCGLGLELKVKVKVRVKVGLGLG